MLSTKNTQPRYEKRIKVYGKHNNNKIQIHIIITFYSVVIYDR